MALETLLGVKEIGGFDVCIIPQKDMPHDEYIKLTEGKFILHNLEKNRITFQLQNGPIKEYGVNGCQVDTVIETAKLIIEGLNKYFPCRENSMVITKLDEALMWSNARKTRRIKQGTEGFNKEIQGREF